MTAARGEGPAVGEIWAYDRADQYAFLARLAKDCDRETAVLYRNNDSALPLIDLMERQGFPYRCRQMDDTFFTHRIVADLLGIIAFANDRKNTEAFLRIYYKIGCGITKKAAEYACEACQRSGKTVLEELLTFSMGNCITMEDTNGNRKLLKKRSDQKIDAVAAMMDAYVAYKHNPEAFE